MSNIVKGKVVSSPDLTWEERHPFSFSLNHNVITRLEKATKQAIKNNGNK